MSPQRFVCLSLLVVGMQLSGLSGMRWRRGKQTGKVQSENLNPKFAQEDPQGTIDEQDAVKGEDLTPMDDVKPELPDPELSDPSPSPSSEEKFDQAASVNNASSPGVVVSIDPVQRANLKLLAGDAGFGIAAGNSAKLLGQFISSGVWDQSMSEGLAAATWSAAAAFVGIMGCPVCGLVMGIAWGFFEGLADDGKDETSDLIYKIIMEHVKVYVNKTVMIQKLEAVHLELNTLRNAMGMYTSSAHLSYSDRLGYVHALDVAATRLSFQLRTTSLLSDNAFWLEIGPILHTVQAVEVFAYTQHQWMFQGESFGDVPQAGAKLRSINQELLKRISSDSHSYDKVWGDIMPKVRVALREDMLSQTQFRQTDGGYQEGQPDGERPGKCSISWSPRHVSYYGNDLHAVTGCARYAGVECSRAQAGCIYVWHGAGKCHQMCVDRCWQHFAYDSICTDSHFNQFFESVYAKWMTYKSDHEELEKFTAVGSVVPHRVASEGEDGYCIGYVRYGGIDSTEDERWSAWQETNGTFHCHDDVFGGDPGAAVKHCECVSHSSSERVASQWEYATCNGVVSYGMGNTWTTRHTSGHFRCSSDFFGDPYPGVAKECRCETFR